MINDIYFPQQLSGEELDEYLMKGWYRMGPIIFSTNHIVYNDQLYSVYWLRYNLQDIKLGKSQQNILTKNAQFSIEIKPLLITEELETLYLLYTSSLSFQASASVSQFLFDGGQSAVFDTDIIEIRDNNTLIAAGIYDKGKQSIAGLLNFYHPYYKKYSLGKYLMLLKVNHAKTLGKTWYYPGYIIHGYPKFDYKLFVDKNTAEMYLPEFDSWIGYNAEIIIALEKGTFNLSDEA